MTDAAGTNAKAEISVKLPADMRILVHLQDRTHDTATNIGKACGLTPGEVRSHLARMASHRWLISYSLNGSNPPSRVHAITDEGLRRSYCLKQRR